MESSENDKRPIVAPTISSIRTNEAIELAGPSIPSRAVMPKRAAEATTETEEIPGRVSEQVSLDLEGDDANCDEAGSSRKSAHPSVDAPNTKGYAKEDSRRSSKDSLPASADFGLRLSQCNGDFDELRESDTNESVKGTMFLSRARVPKKDPEKVEALDNEDDFEFTGTTLVASDSTAKTPKIKDDKAWKVLREKIMAEAKKMNFNPELSEDKQTISVLNKAGDEAMCVERNASDKTLTFSSKPPTTTTPEHLIQLFLVTGSKTCKLENAESAEVAVKLYQRLTKQNIEVTLSSKVLAQLQSDSRYEKIAEGYLLKNPSQAKPTGGSRVIPPAKPTGSRVVPPAAPSEPTPRAVDSATAKVQPDKADTTEAAADTAHDVDKTTSAADPVPDPAHDADEAARSTSPRR